jgi:tripartite-type tricarboxylate transporter receptor subunit TctC
MDGIPTMSPHAVAGVVATPAPRRTHPSRLPPIASRPASASASRARPVRAACHLAATTAAVLISVAAPTAGWAQSATGDWPNRPVRYIVSFAAGATTDILGRMVSAGLTEALGQSFVVENRPGQAGSIGMAELARAKPDGYTIGGGTISSHAINATLYQNLPYDPLKDFEPITLLASLPNMLVVHPALGVDTVAGLVKLLKANPGKYSSGSAGNGTSQHISGEMFKMATGTHFVHIPYRGSGPMIPDLLAGTIQISFENITTAWPHVKSGRLKALAVTSGQRSFVAADVPTMQEAGVKGYEITSWQAMFAPAGTPKSIVMKLQQETARILARPDNARKLQDVGLTAGGGPPEELRKLIASEIPRLGKVVKASGARVD